MTHDPEIENHDQHTDDSIHQFIDGLSSRFAAIELPYHLHVRKDCCSYIQMILSPIDPDELAGDLVPVIGEDSLRRFYKGYIESDPPLALCVASYLFNAVPPCCTIADGPKIELDRDRLTRCIADYARTIKAGDMPISVSLRVANIDIGSDFELASGITFRKVSEDIVRSKYPVDTTFIGVSEAVAQSWFKHRIETVFSSQGKGKELELLSHHEEQDASVNSITHAFLLSGLQDEFHAIVTHYSYDTPIKRFCYTRNVDRVGLEPRLLSDDHIKKLKSAYAFLENANSDSVLRTAVDRYLLGLDRASHHPHATNQPNWDKIVDYVIAMESLFLTVNGTTNSELSYRLRLNGSSMIHLATGEDRRAIFHALKHLYSLRSKIVHGNLNDAVKPARAFFEAFGETLLRPSDQLAIYQKLRKRVEGWLTSVLFFLDTVPPPERPYKKQDGWEELLWPRDLEPNPDDVFPGR